MIADTSYCNAPGLVNLPLANITGGSWDGLGVSGNQFDPTGAGGNGDYVLNYFVTDGNQCTDTLAVNISVVDPDNVEAGADLEICVSETFLDLTVDASPANGSWSVPSFGNIPNGALNPSNLGVGTYTVQYEVGAGNCLVNDQKQLIVHPLPSLDLSGLTTSFCVSQDSILLEALPNGGIWQSNNGGFLRDNFFFPTQSGSGTFTLSYEFTDNQGCISTAIADVVVNELPVVTAADTTVCNVAGTINLPLASPVGGQWSGPGVDNNAFNPTTAGGVGDYTLTYEFTDNNACSSSTTAIISVIEPTTIDAGTDFSVCVSENAVDLFNGVNPVGGTWTEATLGDIPNGLFDAESAGIGTYTFTYSVGAGNCLVTDERVVEVLALPTINLNNPIDEVCENVDGVNFIASPEGGVWTGTGSAVIDSLTFFPNSSGAGIYELTYTYTDGNGCTNAASFDFTVNALPNIVVSDTVICNTPELADLPLALPQDGEWTGTGVVNNQFDAVGAGGIGSYPLMYTFTDLNGCVGRANVNIEVVEPATIDAGPTDTVCIDGGEITLSDFTPINGLWSGPGITDPLGNFDPLLAGGGTQILTYEFGSGNCRVTDTKSIEVIDLRSTSAGNDQTVCLDEPFLQLEGQMPLGGEWSGMGVIENEMGIFVPDSVGVGLQTIVYTFVDDASGCFFSDEKTVEVLPMPESNFSLAAQSCIGDTIQFENNSNSTFLPQWDFGNGDQSMLAEPSYTYQDTGTYLVRLTTQN
ncbi:MAG: PKD domain-containing protein, partial [Bacteroidota bacterium]